MQKQKKKKKKSPGQGYDQCHSALAWLPGYTDTEYLKDRSAMRYWTSDQERVGPARLEPDAVIHAGLAESYISTLYSYTADDGRDGAGESRRAAILVLI